MKISQYLGKRCWLMLFALTFGVSSLSISYANFDFQGDEGANSLTGGDDADDRGDGHDGDGRDCNDYDDADDLGACSDKKLSKIDKKTGLSKHITLCKDTMCPNVGIIADCKNSKHLDKFLAKGYFLQTEYVVDNDGDGAYLEGSEVVSCESPGENYIVKEGAEVDCNDNNAEIFPGAFESCKDIGTDNNCNDILDDVDEICGPVCFIEQLQSNSAISPANPVYNESKWGTPFIIPAGETELAGITVYYSFLKGGGEVFTLDLYEDPNGTPIASASFTNPGPDIFNSQEGIEVVYKFDNSVTIVPGNTYYFFAGPAFRNEPLQGLIINTNDPFPDGGITAKLQNGQLFDYFGTLGWDLKFAVCSQLP